MKICYKNFTLNETIKKNRGIRIVQTNKELQVI